MQNVTLLLLPLLGGYWFAKHWYKTAYELARESDQLIYFKSAAYGSFFLLGSVLLYFVVALTYYWLLADCNSHPFICRASPFSNAFEITSSMFSNSPDPSVTSIYLFAFILGLTWHKVKRWRLNSKITKKIKENIDKWKKEFEDKTIDQPLDVEEDDRAYLLNYHITKRKAEAHNEHLYQLFKNNDFELLVLDAFTREIPLEVTLTNNKVYIGMILAEPNPGLERKSLKILPYASGYRDEHCKLHITTSYYNILKKVTDTVEANGFMVDCIDDFHKVLKAESILSIGFFDFEAYAKFNETNEQPKSAEKEKTLVAS